MVDHDWIDASVRNPTKKDADKKACVLAWHRYNGITVTGWHQFHHDANGFLTHWKPAPNPPPGFEAWEYDDR